jgi:hypothetical protein
MAGKIKSMFPDVRVDIHAPTISANDNTAIRQKLELLVLQEALAFFSPTGDEEFVLWIQNKGCAPAIASGVEICAAALVRQCQVFNANPDEPEMFFTPLTNGSKTANSSQTFKLIPMGEYFWSLERLRVISAWERGDFSEAQLWLKVHQHRYPSLYKLAGILALYINWETDKFVKLIRDWLRSNDVAKLVSNEQIQIWQEQLYHIRPYSLIEAWESYFLIELSLLRKNYTSAFMQFAQLIERLLYIQCSEQNWITKGIITPRPHLAYLGKDYQAGIAELTEGWRIYHNLSEENKWFKLLNRIRGKRNEIVHSAQPATFGQIRFIWTDGGLFTVPSSEDPEIVKALMLDVLKQISPAVNVENLLVPSLYQWGLSLLQPAI